jgi:hypothetical protein
MVGPAMRVSRRWFAALWLALGLLPGVERILLAHVHETARPVLAAETAAGANGARSEGWLDCAACHARASLDALVVDAHPERHGAEPAATPQPVVAEAPSFDHGEPPPARAPPHPIV